MKMIMPIASPATVSVSQVDGEPTSGSAASASTRPAARAASSRTAPSGWRRRQRGRRQTRRWSLMRSQRQPQQPLLQRLVVGQLGHRAAVHDAAVVHHRHACRPARVAMWKFCSTSRIVVLLALQLAEGARSGCWMIDGARPLLGSSISSSARGSTMARATASICFCPPRELAGRVEPELLQRREQAEDPLQPLRVELAGVARRARGQQHVLLHRQVGEDAHALGHVGDAAARRCRAWPGRLMSTGPGSAARPALAPPQAHDRAQRGGLAGAVAAQQHRHLARAARSRSTPCRMWYAPMCVCTPCSSSSGGAHAGSSAAMPR